MEDSQNFVCRKMVQKLTFPVTKEQQQQHTFSIYPKSYYFGLKMHSEALIIHEWFKKLMLCLVKAYILIEGTKKKNFDKLMSEPGFEPGTSSV